MSDLTRLSLLERVQDLGSNDSWDEFSEIYDGLILHWLRCQGVGSHDAEDIRQEVMSALLRELPEFRHNGRPGAFRKWLREITANRIRRHWDKLRREKRSVSGSALESLADQLADDSSRLTAQWEQEYNRHVVEKLLRRIEDRFSANSMVAFRRTALQGVPAEEVARDLGMTLGAVRVARHRVLRALRAAGQGIID